MALWVWCTFLLGLVFLVAIDLGLLTRRPREVKGVEAALSAALWVLTAALFSLLLIPLYRLNVLGVATAIGRAPTEGDAWLHFITAYVTEMALSIDNVAVLGLIFAHFEVRPALRARVLMWIVVASLLFRAVLVMTGAALAVLDIAPWLCAGALLIGIVRTLFIPDQNADVGRRPLFRLAHLLPGPGGGEAPLDANGQQGLLMRRAKRWAFTPLLPVFFAAILADAAFAFDSLPAVFTITRDPFIAFSATALAVLSLRSMYFALSPLIARLRFMKLSLAALLLGLVVKAAVWDFDRVPTLVTLGFVTLVMVVGIGGSLLHAFLMARKTRIEPRPTPLEDLSEAALAARRNFRKALVLIAGTAIVVAGIAIAPLPGPGGMIVVPLGIALLATEFIWAKRLLETLKSRVEKLALQGDKIGAKIPRWFLVPIVLGYYAFFAGLYLYSPVPKTFLVGTCVGLSFPLWVWVYRTNKLIGAPSKPVGSQPESPPARQEDPVRPAELLVQNAADRSPDS